MPKLEALQREFQTYLIHPVDENQQNEKEAQALSWVAPSTTFSAQNRLKVYYDAYRLRLLEVLQSDFPKCYVLMGEEAFTQAFLEYLLTYPSQHFSVRYFGQHFAQFLKTQAPFSSTPYLAEMVDFEWALSHALDAKDALCLTPQMLLAFSSDQWENTQFDFHPSVTLLSFDYETPLQWQKIPSCSSQKQAVNFTKLDLSQSWIIWRKDLKSLFQSLSAFQFEMAIGIRQQATLATLCETMQEKELADEDTVVEQVVTGLYQWADHQLLTIAS